MPARILYLHGFASSPRSSKARTFQDAFAARGVAITVPDLAPDFFHLTLTSQLRILHEAAAGEPVALIGSSMGGYLAALYAAEHPAVTHLVLLAPAFRFAKHWAETLGPQRVRGWQESGALEVLHYGSGQTERLGFQLLSDGSQYPDFPRAPQPTLLFHGVRDEVVPAAFSEEYARGQPQVRLRLLDTDHQMLSVQTLMAQESWDFLHPAAAGAPRSSS